MFGTTKRLTARQSDQEPDQDIGRPNRSSLHTRYTRIWRTNSTSLMVGTIFNTHLTGSEVGGKLIHKLLV
jgi:hypothetical protein